MGFATPSRNRSSLFRILPLAMAGLVAGCTTSEDAGADPGVEDRPPVSEPALLAGSTSSTNWPVEIGKEVRVTVMGRTDSQLVLYFRRARDLGKGYDTVRVSGRLRVFDGSAIPALDSVDHQDLEFSDADSLVIPPRLIDSLRNPGQDTVSVSLLLHVDTMQCFVPGFVHSESAAKFIHSPFPDNPPSAFTLSGAGFRFEGKVDTAGSGLSMASGQVHPMCFYIPGSPYFWRPGSSESISLGPLSEGPYPLRYLRVLPEGPGSRLEVYEVIATKRIPGINGQPTKPPTLRIGNLLFSRTTGSPVSLRPAAP